MLSFNSGQLGSPFNEVVVHYQSPPPTGGDYGTIFVADNMTVTPVPEPAAVLALAAGATALIRLGCRATSGSVVPKEY